MNKTMSFIVKTVSGCNLACQYCYSPHRRDDPLQVIPESVLVRVIEGTVELGISNVQFVWHGGEPLLAGLDFFEHVVALQQRYGQSWQCFDNVMQSNGTLVDEDWIAFFQKHKFGIGVSLDGDSEAHDCNRRLVTGGQTHQVVSEKFRLLRQHGCGGGVCAVVSRDSLGRAQDIVDYFVSKGVPEFDFLPCIGDLANPSSIRKAISADEYASFMVSAFDRWFELDNPDVSVRFFTNIIAMLLGGTSDFCQFTPVKCRNYLAIDYTGDVYPCDNFIGEERWKLGSLLDNELTILLSGDRRREFLRKMDTLDPDCKKCQWLRVCWGGCTYHRYMSDHELRRKSVFCKARKKIISHIAKSLSVKAPIQKACPIPDPPSESSVPTLELYVDLGPVCNSRCYFCAASASSTGGFDLEAQERAILLGREAGATKLVLTGGEPTIHANLLELIAKASGAGFAAIQLQSNGRLLRDYDYLAMLVKAGITDFGVSLHGHTATIHEANTQMPGSFEETVRGIENVAMMFGPNPPIAANCVISPLNLAHLQEVAELLVQLGASTIKFSYLHAIGRAQHLLKRGNWPSKTEVLPFLLDAVRTVERLGRSTSLAIEAIPYCLLKGAEVYCSDRLIRPVLQGTPEGSIEVYDVKSERVKRPDCRSCTFDPLCAGPWRQYPAEFGWEEFEPILGDLPTWANP